MLETTVIQGNGNRRRKRLIILPISIGLHIALIAGAVFSAVWRVELPGNAPPQIASYQAVTAVPVPPPAPRPPLRRQSTAPQQPVQPRPDQLVAPPEVPETTPQPSAEPGSDTGSDTGSPNGVPGGDENGSDDGVIGGVTTEATPQPPIQAQPRVRVSKPPRIIYQVKPDYPRSALLIRLKNGYVVLDCVVDRSGNVRNVRVISSSHHFFESESVEALRQWRFEPAVVNGAPVEVEFQLRVNFTAQ